jgi:hypothetical protein
VVQDVRSLVAIVLDPLSTKYLWWRIMMLPALCRYALDDHILIDKIDDTPATGVLGCIEALRLLRTPIPAAIGTSSSVTFAAGHTPPLVAMVGDLGSTFSGQLL